jgi:hypothetical protein
VTFLKTSLLCGALAFAAQAQVTQPAHFLLGAGVSFGGDTLATVEYTDGKSGSIKAGGGFTFKTGLDYRLNRNFALQATLGYQKDSQGADNGKITFTRVPVEVLAFYYPRDRFRMGLGLRKANSATLDSSGVANMGSFNFDASTGTVLEVEWLLRKTVHGQGGFTVRFVSEKFTLSDYPGAGSIDGNHIGCGFNWYF